MHWRLLPVILLSAGLWSCATTASHALKDREVNSKLGKMPKTEPTSNGFSIPAKDSETEIPFPKPPPT